MSEENKKEQVEQTEINPQTSEENKTEKTKAEETTEEKYVPQSKIDDIVQRRIAREREKYADYDDLKSRLSEYEQAEQEKRDAEMSEIEKLQAKLSEYEQSVEEANKATEETLKSANGRLIKSEFKMLAKDSGIRSDALDAAYKLADFDKVTVDDEGNVQGVKDVIEALKETNKFLFGATNYADPTPGQHEANRKEKDQTEKRLKELEDKARKSGRIEDKIAYAKYKKELGV